MAVHTKEKAYKKAFVAVEKLYEEIPDTRGCMEHINKDPSCGGCGGNCCKFQNPQLLYIEFMRTWKYVLDTFSKEQQVELIEKVLKNYLSNVPTKGCIFWNKETKLCGQHKTRPLACYLYGITPDEEFAPKYERLKQYYANDPAAVIMDQCKLVSTIDGRKLTMKDTDGWWHRLVNIEKSIGIDGNILIPHRSVEKEAVLITPGVPRNKCVAKAVVGTHGVS